MIKKVLVHRFYLRLNTFFHSVEAVFIKDGFIYSRYKRSKEKYTTKTDVK